MTNLTPQQEEALNRAIAKHAGWTDIGMKMAPSYTRDLNAIVAVVQKWCETQENISEFQIELNFIEPRYPKYKCTVDIQEPYVDALGNDTYRWQFIEGRNNNPALALILAFAKAAGIKWEETENGGS